MLTGIMTLAGVALGYWLTERRAVRRDAALVDALRPRIANTVAPTVAEINDRLAAISRRALSSSNGKRWSA